MFMLNSWLSYMCLCVFILLMMLQRILHTTILPLRIALRKRKRITRFEGIKAMLENKHGEIPKQPLLAAGIISAAGALAAGALKLDHYFGRRGIDNTEIEPDFVIDHRSGSDQTLVLLGGLCMNTHSVAKNFRSQLADTTSLVAPVFPETCFDPEIIFEKTFEKIEQINPKEILIAGLSMGGIMACDWLEYGLKTGRQDIVERVSGIVTRGTPFGKDAIRFAPRMLLNTVSRLGYSYTLDHGRSLLKNFNCRSLIEANPAKVVPQCRYLAGNHTSPLVFAPERIIFVRGLHPDPIVDEKSAIKAFEKKVGRPVEQVVDNSSTKSEHAPTNRMSAWFMLDQLGIAKPKQASAPQQAILLPSAA